MLDEEKAADKLEKRRYRPFKFSGKNFTFDIAHEKPLLDDLRRWSCNYFQNEYVITKEMYKYLKDIKSLVPESGAT